MCVIEMNFARLLHCAEDLATAGKAHERRFESYFEALKRLFNDLIASDDRPTTDYVQHYESRLNQLECAKKLAETSDPEQRASVLISSVAPLIPRPVSDDLLCISASRPLKASALAVDAQRLPCSLSDVPVAETSIRGLLDSPPCVRKSEQRKVDSQNRKFLLGCAADALSHTNDESVLMHGQPSGNGHYSRAQLLHKEEFRREELASEMLNMAIHLKDQSAAMSDRLKSDQKTIESSINQADQNKSDLSVVLDQLSEELGSRCARIVWIVLLIALVVFFQMIAFMKLFRKRTWHATRESLRTEL
ncbi:unconventional SNARE in the endoplasmic reticulum protein 1 [Paragonimus westermani]|uniref:Vesicle transport protein USE1 n=1 Tax=Paragonimus westermani TaxID=34504 RepID=A0A5J4N7Y9_9TREM|nr:unconventional SNARE in the endoplasmic reticulum protein 1 [Paragonimus westermani]